jgi:hypothetical protein
MWMGDAQERTLQADPELHHLWESQQNLAQDEEPASDQGKLTTYELAIPNKS